jgi:predicted ATP-dependent serine protease
MDLNDVNEPKRGRGRPPKSVQEFEPVRQILFDDIGRLSGIEIDPRMLGVMKSHLKSMDELMSFEKGLPCATNIMCIGDPGVGKTTVLLDYVASIKTFEDKRILFVSAEMGRKQMFKYTERFKQFGNIKTVFMQDYTENNTKDVIEEIFNVGWDVILIDSAAEVIDGVRDDNNWDRKKAEYWFLDLLAQQNIGENDAGLFTTNLVIQQVTKGGVFSGSNKLKHLMDGMIEMRREAEKDGGDTYMMFSKNRNGKAGIKMYFDLGTNSITYGQLMTVDED